MVLLPVLEAAHAAKPQMATSGYHTLVLREDGSLWATGGNYYGQLGDGTTQDKGALVKIGDGYVSIAAGQWHSAAVRSDGSLWAWGYNARGGVGTGTTSERAPPTRVNGSYKAVAAASNHTYGLATDGSLWAWGDDVSSPYSNPVPQRVPGTFTAVATSETHTLATAPDGSLWAWGGNTFGEVGDGTKTKRESPVRIGTGFVAVAAGRYFSLALRSDGGLWAWGQNDFGQFGNGNRTSSLVPVQVGTGFSAIAAGRTHAVALRADGGLWLWGFTGFVYDGVLDYSPQQLAGSYVVAAAGDVNTLALTASGGLCAWGNVSPAAPESVVAVPGDEIGTVRVSFAPPSCGMASSGGFYVAEASPGGAAIGRKDSPIVISGLSSNATYTFTVRNTGGSREGLPSRPSNAVKPRSTASYFPLAPGLRWTYQQGSATSTLTVQSPTTMTGGSAAYPVMHADGKVVYLTNDSAGLRQHGMHVPGGVCITETDCRDYTAVFSPPVTLVPAGGGSMPVRSDGSARVTVAGLGTYALSLEAMSSPRGTEQVSALGQMLTAIKYEYSIRVSGLAEGEFINVGIGGTQWLAHGYGLVKETIGDQTALLTASNVVLPSDCLFNWAERQYAALFASTAPTLSSPPYRYRYYAKTGVYLGISTTDDHVYYMQGGSLNNAGPASIWYGTAGCQ